MLRLLLLLVATFLLPWVAACGGGGGGGGGSPPAPPINLAASEVPATASGSLGLFLVNPVVVAGASYPVAWFNANDTIFSGGGAVQLSVATARSAFELSVQVPAIPLGRYRAEVSLGLNNKGLVPVRVVELIPNMAPIPAGVFLMGSDDAQAPANERPVHGVTITQPFWMGQFEVTQADYQAVMGSNPSFFQGASYPDSASRPVEQVSWNDAVAYCDAVTALETAEGRLPSGYEYRLPTEAEWEYCCRAGTTTEWNVGGSLSCGQANHQSNAIYCVPGQPLGGQSSAVGSYAANAWGLHDMHGNVMEWCLDSWDDNPNYPAGAVSDPFVSSGPFRVIRGGGWSNVSAVCRSAYRSVISPSDVRAFLGFRVVCAPVR